MVVPENFHNYHNWPIAKFDWLNDYTQSNYDLSEFEHLHSAHVCVPLWNFLNSLSSDGSIKDGLYRNGLAILYSVWWSVCMATVGRCPLIICVCFENRIDENWQIQRLNCHVKVLEVLLESTTINMFGMSAIILYLHHNNVIEIYSPSDKAGININVQHCFNRTI